MANRLQTGRGVYLLDLAGDPEVSADAVILPLKLEHEAGMERILFRCRIAKSLLDSDAAEPTADLVGRLASWIAPEFEQVREAALKSIRTEKKLFELSFDSSSTGPFRD